MKSGARSTQEIDFPEAQRLLFILTGLEPIRTHGKIDKLHEGEHLRFVFTKTTPEFYLVIAMLKILDIQHCSELFKDSVSPMETYITVSKRQFNKLYSYFAPGAFVASKNRGLTIDFFENEKMQSALMNILLNPRFLESLKIRNNNEYNLDGLMSCFGQLLFNAAPCFKHLKEQGVNTEFSISLEVEQEASSETLPESKVITHLRATQGKRAREVSAKPPAGNDDPNSKRVAFKKPL